MSEGINFNPNNARFINTNINTAKAVAAEVVNTVVQQAVVQNTQQFVNQSARSLYQFFANLQASQQLQANEMSLVLKDLLNMQKDIESFLTTMADGRAAAQMSKADIAQLLMNSQMDLSKMMAFMQQNGKEALGKLFNMTAKFAPTGNMATGSQMGELIAILNACTPKADTQQVQVLKNMMLLYLPWLPLGEQNFSIEIGTSSKNGEEGGGGEDSVSILIQTVNFGNVQVLIFKSDSTINFNITAGDLFPKDEVIDLLKAEANDYNVQTEMSFEKKEVLNKPKKPDNAQTQVSVNTSSQVNPFLILMAQLAVKIIIDIDKNASLLENRKSKLE